jgi:hypothetical protein
VLPTPTRAFVSAWAFGFCLRGPVGMIGIHDHRNIGQGLTKLGQSRRITAAAVTIGAAVGGVAAVFAAPIVAARPSDPGVVSYAVLGKGSVGNIVGGPMRDESLFTQPFQPYFVDNPVCNNWADIGLPEVYNDPDLASFNGASTQTSPTDQTHFVKQAVGVFATGDAAGAAFHRVVDRTGPLKCGPLTAGRQALPTRPGASRKPEPTVDVSLRPICGKTSCCKPKSVSPATVVRR